MTPIRIPTRQHAISLAAHTTPPHPDIQYPTKLSFTSRLPFGAANFMCWMILQFALSTTSLRLIVSTSIHLNKSSC